MDSLESIGVRKRAWISAAAGPLSYLESFRSLLRHFSCSMHCGHGLPIRWIPPN